MDAIRCDNLTKAFGAVVAVNGLNLHVERGATFALLGPNGAGKTTALRLFTGITNPTGGHIWVMGEDVSQRSLQLRSKVGYLPETPAFYGWMTGREFLLFTGALYGQPTDQLRQRATELIERVGLQDAAGRRCKTYSRGMQQRLGLAQALMNRPEVLFLDEPASALDPMGRRDMLEAIKGLKGETTVVLCTHILADVERVCDRVAILNRGTLVTEGSLDELRSRSGVDGSSVFELEFVEDVASFIPSIAGKSWLKAIKLRERGARRVLQLEVNNLEQAKQALPRLVFSSNLTPVRYELTTSTLEEVFVGLVGDAEPES